jgi:hypothetical protein
MNAIDREVYRLMLADWSHSARMRLRRLDHALLQTRNLPSEFFASVILIACVYFYLSHGMRLPQDKAVSCILLLALASLLDVLSLYTRHGVLCRVRAVLCLLCSLFLMFHLRSPV